MIIQAISMLLGICISSHTTSQQLSIGHFDSKSNRASLEQINEYTQTSKNINRCQDAGQVIPYRA